MAVNSKPRSAGEEAATSLAGRPRDGYRAAAMSAGVAQR